MAAIPTYESKVTLQPNNGGGEVTPINTSKLFPANNPDFSKVSAALMSAQKRMDKARVLEYKNAMLQYVSDNTYGENGYLTQFGKNALEQDAQGKGLTERGLAGYDKYSEDWLKNNHLTPAQMKLVREENFGIRLQYQNGMSSHVLQEGKRYQVEQCETAATNAINEGLMATTPESQGIAFARLKQARESANEILGLDGETAKAQWQADTSKFWSAIFTKNLLTTDKDPIGGYNKAKAILDAHYKEMDAATILDCRAKLRAAEENKALANVLNGQLAISTVEGTPGANAVSLLSTNNKKTVGNAIHHFLTKGNRQTGDGTHVATYANGGIGVSGVRPEDMLKVVHANKMELNPANLSDDELMQRFVENRDFNYTVGTTYASMLVKKYGDDEKTAVAYQMGEEKVEEAVKLATEAGKPDEWLKYVKGDTANVRKVIRGIREYQDGIIRGADGKVLDPCSAGFIKNQNPLPTDEQLDAMIVARDGGYTARNPMARERFRSTLRAKSVQELANKERQYRQNFYSCVQAIQNNQDMPNEAYNALPVSAQHWMRKFQDKRNMGDGTPDWAAYSKYKTDTALLARMSEEDFNTFVAPLMGNKLEEITTLRQTNRAAMGLALDQKYANNVAANKGQLDWSFSPASDDLKGGIAKVFFSGKMENSPRFNGLYWRLQTAVTYEAQRRAHYSSTGKAVPLKGAELEHFLMKFKADMDQEGVIPMRMSLSEIPDRTEKDALSLTQMLADRMMLNQSGRNVPGTKDQQQMAWGAVLSGELPEGVNISIDELRSDFRISQSVLKEAEGQLKREGKYITNRGLLNRYALILCGWTPTGRGLPFVGQDAPRSNYTMADFRRGELNGFDY